MKSEKKKENLALKVSSGPAEWNEEARQGDHTSRGRALSTQGAGKERLDQAPTNYDRAITPGR